MEQKKRRLLIIDVPTDPNAQEYVEPTLRVEVTGPRFAAPVITDDTLGSIGVVHAQLQRHVGAMAKYYRCDDEIDPGVWIRIDRILKAKNGVEATALVRSAANSSLEYFLGLWCKGKIPGPDTPEARERQAKTAERVANLYISKGDDEAAKKQFEKAKQLRSKSSEKNS